MVDIPLDSSTTSNIDNDDEGWMSPRSQRRAKNKKDGQKKNGRGTKNKSKDTGFFGAIKSFVSPSGKSDHSSSNGSPPDINKSDNSNDSATNVKISTTTKKPGKLDFCGAGSE